MEAFPAFLVPEANKSNGRKLDEATPTTAKIDTTHYNKRHKHACDMNFSVVRITTLTSKLDVQHAMNVAIGTTRWYGGRKDIRWSNFLAARNLFVEHHLQKEISISEYRQLKLDEKKEQVHRLSEAFIKEFFQYTRDNSWMQEAVGDNVDWINITGMSDWHIKAALASLQSAQDSREVAPSQPTGM